MQCTEQLWLLNAEQDGAYSANKAGTADIMTEVERIGSLTAWQHSALHQAALDMKQAPQAYVEGTAALLQPGEECMCPIRWSFTVPDEDFTCVQSAAVADDLEVYKRCLCRR